MEQCPYYGHAERLALLYKNTLRNFFDMYLTRRGSRYYMRIRVPADVRHAYSGRKEILVSLRTSDRADAKNILFPLCSKYLDHFRKIRSGEVDELCSRHDFILVTERKKNTVLLSDVYEKFLNERKPVKTTRSEFDCVVQRLIAICGDKDIRSYSTKDIILFKDVLLQYPKVLKKSDYNLDPYQILEKYKDSVKISNVTVDRKFLALAGSLFNFAKQNGFRCDNPCDAVKVIIPPRMEPPRVAFTPEQMRKIISADLFQNPQAGKYIEYKFITLICIYTGARITEIASLKMADLGEENGIPFIHIKPDLDSGRTIKTYCSYRRVPLHKDLFEYWKFDEYLSGAKSQSGYIFPILNSNNNTTRVSQPLSKFFSRLLIQLNIKQQNLSFHSLRHTFKAFARRSKIDRTIVDTICGHSNEQTAMEYGRDFYGSPYDLKILSDAVQSIADFEILKK